MCNDPETWCTANATKLLVEPTNADRAWGDFAANEYTHLYYPEDVFDLQLDCDPLDHIKSYKYFCGGNTTRAIGTDQGGSAWLMFAFMCEAQLCRPLDFQIKERTLLQRLAVHSFRRHW